MEYNKGHCCFWKYSLFLDASRSTIGIRIANLLSPLFGWEVTKYQKSSFINGQISHFCSINQIVAKQKEYLTIFYFIISAPGSHIFFFFFFSHSTDWIHCLQHKQCCSFVPCTFPISYFKKPNLLKYLLPSYVNYWMDCTRNCIEEYTTIIYDDTVIFNQLKQSAP